MIFGRTRDRVRARYLQACGKHRQHQGEIEQYLVSQGPGAHTVVGVDRANGFAGHWFNAYYDGSRVYAVDGQTGQIAGWPPDMDLPNVPVTVWDMGVLK
jgi:hypothetical protein